MTKTLGDHRSHEDFRQSFEERNRAKLRSFAIGQTFQLRSKQGTIFSSLFMKLKDDQILHLNSGTSSTDSADLQHEPVKVALDYTIRVLND